MSDRFDVQVLGVTIGTADGWDEAGIPCLNFYNFQPSIVGLEPAECILLEYATGKLEAYNGEGEVAYSKDLLPLLKSL